MQKTIVTILSTNYAGSHFLSLLLGSHSRACHIGELRRVVEGLAMAREVSFCHICNPQSECPAIRGLTGASAESTYAKVFENFAALGRHPQALIDASKLVKWASRFVNQSTYRFKYVHLIRDPRALVRRDMLNKSDLKRRVHARRQAAFRGPKVRLSLLIAPMWKVSLCKWYNKNVEIAEFLRRHGCDTQVVTYRDLATDTVGEVRRLDAWMGLQFEPAQIEYWQFDHHGSQKVKYDWIKQQKKTGYFDLRWKEFFSAETAAAIACDADVTRLLSRLSLRLDDIGLTRKPSGAMASPAKAA